MLQALGSGGSPEKIPLRSSTSLGVGWGWDGERLEPLDLSMIWYESEGVTQFTGGLAQESDQSEFESWLDYI